MSCDLVDRLKKAHPVSQLCGVLGVHKSRYYYWQAHRQPTARRVHLQVQAKAIHAETRQTYGSRRLSQELRAKGLDVGRHQARSLMREAGLVAVRPQKRHAYPAGEASRVAANVLDRQFDAARPDEKWVGDITYLWTAAGWVYLAVVLDLFSRKVVGWCLSDAPDTRLILAALDQAATLRRIAPGSGLLFHSDQGCQYTSHAYQDRLAALGIQASMSRRGNCWDNAVMERFFRSLKTESTSRDRHQTHEEVGWAVNKYIHFYNTRRIHSAAGGMSPNQAEQLFLKQA
jgi:putative transposase